MLSDFPDAMGPPRKDSSKQASRPLADAFAGIYSKAEHIDYAVVDTFSELAFRGNPAAVIVLPAFRDEEWMQSVAAEFNLSETSYLVKRDTKRVEGDTVVSQQESLSLGLETEDSLDSEKEDVDKAENEAKEAEESKERASDGKNENETEEESKEKASEGNSGKTSDGNNEKPIEGKKEKQFIHEYDLRWYTPKVEVDLCGHATLAAAHVLYASGLVGKKDSVFFHTKSGLLSVRLVGPEESDAQSQSEDGRKMPKVDMIELNLPWITTTPSPLSSVRELARTLKNVSVAAVGKANHRLIVELDSKDDVENLKPDMQELQKSDCEGLFVTSSGGPVSEFDFISRCFFPKLGVDEDPVCGSAHCALGPYWSTKLGKADLLAYQASKRGGTLVIQVDKKIGRVYIRGQASIVMAGVLLK